MRLSDEGAAFVASQEGAINHWYLDTGSVWTIGIGHAWDGSDEFADIAARNADGTWSPGRRLTEVEMWDLFRKDAERFTEAINRLVTVPLTQHQWDMVFDFAFNWGIGERSGFPATSVLKFINDEDWPGVAEELVNGRGRATEEYPNGRPYDKGLAHVRKRRQLEAAAFKAAPLTNVEVILAVAADLAERGINVVFIDGWKTRGRPYAFIPRGLVWHHTASRGYEYDYPSLGIVRDGRSDLPGPLAQFGLGRHTGTVYVIAAGHSNHAGGGGWNGLSGNGSAWGVEAENDGIGEEWSGALVASYIALAASLCVHGGISPDNNCRHAEWSDGGKIDTATSPLDDGDWIRSQVAAAVDAYDSPTPVPEEDDTMRLVGVTNGRGIFLVGATPLATVRNKGKTPALHVDHPTKVDKLVAAGVVPGYNKADLPESLFDSLYTVVGIV